MEEIIQNYWQVADLKRRLLKLIETGPPAQRCQRIFLHKKKLSLSAPPAGSLPKNEPVLEMIRQILSVNEQLVSLNPNELENYLRYRIQNPTVTVRLLKIIFKGCCNQPPLSTLLRQQSIFLNDLLFNKLCETLTEENWADFSQLLKNELSLHTQFFRDYQALLKSPLELKILGYGEISTVMKPVGKFRRQSSTKWIYKRMPIFPSLEDVKKYRAIYRTYRELLTRDCGLKIPEQKIWYVVRPNGTVSVYALQEMVNPDLIGHKLIRHLTLEQGRLLFKRILNEMQKVWAFNQTHSDVKIGLDGQISNWALDARQSATRDEQIRADLIYLDTSTPLYRVNGTEQLDPEIFIKNSPSFLRTIIRLFFLQDVLDRYYDFRSVVVDLIANLYKEGVPQFIPQLVQDANELFATQFQAHHLSPLTEKEIKKYYKQDAFIWRFFQTSRKIDKFLTEKIKHRRYEYRLPGKIKR